ncbi:MAG: 16S rRNA (uracil(1498)-N(3))-methyltransferase [Cytophagales bacterium]|nr:16S rRNA (uracil(1498)-N(3))-methyltransferase [Cytophagales bacterium]
MNLFYQPGIAQGVLHLDPGESRHCIKVLRKGVGEKIHIVDGTGGFYQAEITNDDPKQCTFKILGADQSTKRNYYVHIAIAPTKNMDRLEWFIEKATEIGVDEVSPVICQNSERRTLKTDRLEKKAIAAMKQCLKAELPKINPALDFKPFIQNVKASHKYIAYVDSENPKTLYGILPPASHSCILIGPEGDFSKEELLSANELGWTKVSLGPNRLRTETAGLVACHISNLVNS